MEVIEIVEYNVNPKTNILEVTFIGVPAISIEIRTFTNIDVFPKDCSFVWVSHGVI